MLLRRARPGDELAVAEVHVRSWQVAYRGLLPDDYLDSLEPARRAERYTFAASGPDVASTTVAVENGSICGFATVGPSRDDDSARAGELYAIYLHPDRWGRGVGLLLIRDARSRLVDHGRTEALLWVLAGNDRAERFYRLDGWLPDGRQRRDEVQGVEVDEVRYRRRLP